MKFSANRSEMQPIIKRCCLVIGRQFTTKETVCILMEADEDHNRVQFTAMGNECVLQARLNCYVEHSGKAMMIGSVMQSMLELFREEVTTVETDDTTISVRNAKAGYSFALMDTKKYPVPEPCMPETICEADGFCDISSKVLFSVAKGNEQNLRVLNCIRVTVHDGQWSATSCDSYRLTMVSKDTTQTQPLDMLLAVDAMKTVLHVFNGIPHYKVGVSNGNAVFCGPGMVLRARLNEEQYVNIQPLIDHFHMVHEVQVDGGVLLDTLKRISAGSTTNAKLLLLPVDDRTMRLQFISNANSTVSGQIEMDCVVKTPLPKDGFCYNYIYLKEAASLMQGNDIAVQFDKTGAMMLRADNELHLLLPTRQPKVEEKPKTKRMRKAA